MSIKRENLKVGLKTDCGKRVTAIGDIRLLFTAMDNEEYTMNVNRFCEIYTEQCTDEIIEVEMVISSQGIAYFKDISGKRICDFPDSLYEKTLIRKQYNKTKREFVE